MKLIIEEHIRKNIKLYILLTTIFLIGVILGILFINNTKNETKTEINNYILNFISNIQSNNSINYGEILKNTITRNIKLVILIVLLAFSIWGEIANSLLVGYKGFCLGYSMSAVISMIGVGKGIILILSLTLINQVLLIPTVFFIIISSNKVYTKLMKGDFEEKRIVILKYLICLIMSILVIVFSSLIQTYLNSNLFLFFLKYY